MNVARRSGGTRLMLLVAAAAALAGCGQRGDLYLPTPSRAVVPQATLHYQLVGTGPQTVVLLQEAGASRETWDGVMPELTRTHRVLRYDLRGSGQPDRSRGSVRIEDEVADLAGLLDSLGIGEPVTLVGGETGTAIALRFAADHPQRTRAVLALSPATGAAHADGNRADAYAAALQAGRVMAIQSPDSLAPLLRGFLARP